MNTASLSSISTTINGTAELVPFRSEQDSWYKAQHLANNTFGRSEEDNYVSSSAAGDFWGEGRIRNLGRDETDIGEGDGGTKCYVEDDDVRVVIVRITGGRIADWKGQTRDWTVTPDMSLGTLNGT
jgi:hypothetical protein